AAPLTTDPAINQVGPWDILPAQWPFVLGGRVMVVAFALLGVWLMYRLGAAYAAPSVGIVAALFLATSALHNESSHYLTTDVPATPFLPAALWCGVHLARHGEPMPLRWLAIAGACAGAAAATKYTAGIAVLVLLVITMSSSRRLTARRWAVIAAAAAVGFL